MRMIPSPDQFAADQRSVSEVVAVALLIGVVVLGVTAVLLVGVAELTDERETVGTSQAEGAFVQFDSAAERVATGRTTSQRIDLGLRANGGTTAVENDTGHITVEYINVTDGSRTTVVDRSLGTMVYENGDTTVGYQGGGVWRSDGSGSTMLSPPEITYRDETFTMSVIGTRGSSIYSDVRVSRTGTAERFPNASASLTNRVRQAEVRITIESRYYRAWGEFFAEETNSVVQYDDANQRATVILLALPRDFSPEAGVIATSGPGELRLEGNGAYIDSYNSSEGPYEDSNTGNGTVRAAGDVTLKGDSEIRGTTRAGKNISVGSSSRIDGDALANGSITVEGSGTITGDNNSNVPYTIALRPINKVVYDRTDELRERNDNNETTVIQDEELQIDGDSETLSSGDYYLDNLELEGETLVLDTTDGNITIAVRDWATLEKVSGMNSHIEVEGDGRVRLFVASRQTTEVNVPGGGSVPSHFFVERNSTIDVPGDRSYRFQIYGPDNFIGRIGGSSSESADVTAAVVAPSGPDGSGLFYAQHSDLYGAVVTGNLTLGQSGEVHFDRALMSKDLLLAPNTPRLLYLYITEYEIEVEDS